MSNEERAWDGIARFLVELSGGLALALVLLLGLLWFLDARFAGATGLGRLIRGADSSPARSEQGSSSQDDAVVARLTEAHNDVRDKPPASVVWSRARVGSGLGSGHAIQSGAASSAGIDLDEHNRIHLRERSLLVLRRPERSPESRRMRTSLVFLGGRLEGSFIGGAVSGVDVELLTGASAVRPSDSSVPTRLAVSVDGDASALAVLEGSAELRWGETVTVVPAGFMAAHDGQHPPGAPTPLPQPPVLLSPADGARVGHRGTTSPVTFRWRSSASSGQRLQIAQDLAFARLVFEDEVRGDHFVHGTLGAGKYYWRVIDERTAPLDLASPASRFAIERDETPPSLEVDFPRSVVQGATWTIQGTTESDCSIVVGDEAVAVDDAGRFSHVLPLRSGYNFVVIQSIDPAGNTTFRNHTLLADLEAIP